MDPESLKANWGGKIIFWGGGVDTQSVLPFGKPGEVRKQVKERLQVFGAGGGYVFNPIHNIQAGVPPENIVAAFDAAFEYGGV
jgi:uroporphyrinogen decarboxylase